MLLCGNSVQALIDSPDMKPQTESRTSNESDRTRKYFRDVIIDPFTDPGCCGLEYALAFVIHANLSRPPCCLSEPLRVAAPVVVVAERPTPGTDIPSEAGAR